MRDAFDELPSGPIGPIGHCRYYIEPILEESDTMDEGYEEPEYYNNNGLSPIGAFQRGLISEDELIGFYKGNIIKYVVRAGKKGSALEDLLKAKSYINFYMDLFLMPSTEEEKLDNEETEIFKALNGLNKIGEEED